MIRGRKATFSKLGKKFWDKQARMSAHNRPKIGPIIVKFGLLLPAGHLVPLFY